MRAEALTDRGSGPVNGDSYAIVSHERGLRLAVFDGVSAVPGAATTPGAAAAIAAREAAWRTDGSPEDVLGAANDRIRELNAGAAGSQEDAGALAAAAVGAVVHVDLASRTLDYALVGDCVVYVAAGATREVHTDRRFEQFSARTFAAMREARERGIVDPDEQLAAAWDHVVANRRAANRADGTGHGLLNGMATVARYVLSGRVALPLAPAVIAVLSDGMLPPGAGDDAGLVEAIGGGLHAGGLGALLAATRAAERADPALESGRSKLHDDATGVMVEVSEADWRAAAEGE